MWSNEKKTRGTETQLSHSRCWWWRHHYHSHRHLVLPHSSFASSLAWDRRFFSFACWPCLLLCSWCCCRTCWQCSVDFAFVQGWMFGLECVWRCCLVFWCRFGRVAPLFAAGMYCCGKRCRASFRISSLWLRIKESVFKKQIARKKKGVLVARRSTTKLCNRDSTQYQNCCCCFSVSRAPFWLILVVCNPLYKMWVNFCNDTAWELWEHMVLVKKSLTRISLFSNVCPPSLEMKSWHHHLILIFGFVTAVVKPSYITVSSLCCHSTAATCQK